jgi:hypothetical protein
MIWFDIKQLENKISNNELSDKEGFYYFLAYSIFQLIILSLFTDDSNSWKLSGLVIAIVITIWGLWATYDVNNEIDGKDYLKRYLAISWVIGMRLIVVSILIGILLGILFGMYSVKNNVDLRDPNPLFDLAGLIFQALFTLICYLLIINSFRRLKNRK